MMTTTTWTTDLLDQSRNSVRARHFRHWFCILGLAIADAFCFFLADLVFRADASVPTVVLFVGRLPHAPSTPLNVFALLAAAFVIVRYISGDYSRRQLFFDGAKGTTIALLITAIPDLLMYALGGGIYVLTPILLSWFSLLIFVPIVRQGARVLMSRIGVWQIPTAMIGVSARTAEICAALHNSLSLGFDVRWLVIEDESSKAPASLSRIRLIHSSDPSSIAQIIGNAGCKQAIVSGEDVQTSSFADVVQRLLEASIPVAVVPSLNRLPLAGATTSYFFGQDILMLQVRSNLQRLPWRIVKRSLDLVVSALLLLLLFPLFVVFAIAIKLDTAGPITYSQRRVGRHGAQFDCLKFRTMAPDADAILDQWKTENPELYKEFLVTFKLRDDPRVTGVGKWLRKTSLDELPQLWNVLRGEMSLVGPRPIPEQQLRDQYGSAAQLYVRVRPGMSGLWQISGRSETTSDQRVVLDEWYILNWSFWYDIVILIQTAWIVITGKGAF
jgi:undecaprenyl-phosphate galactose phosphotransferase